MNQSEPIIILMADDDPDDRMLIEEAWEENNLSAPLHFVPNGEELMDYLHRRGNYTHLKFLPLPSLILLDLNMPRKDGREALREIKADPKLRYIPIVVLTTSQAEEDIFTSYDLGANSFIVKPPNFDSLVAVVKTLATYWLGTTKTPIANNG